MKFTLILFCMALLFVFEPFSANAQSTIIPTASTIQFAGTPAQSSITAPTGAQVLYGTALSPITNQPVRHLWVGDATAGLCRMDPDLDSPGPYAINPATCLSGFAILGGAMAFDSVNNLLGAGIAWMGHDLWGASPESVYVIPMPILYVWLGPIRRAVPATAQSHSLCRQSLAQPHLPAINFIPPLTATIFILACPPMSHG